jgi:16S rRNA processing protein RimM
VTSTVSAPEESYVLLGTITRPHGIRGELKVRSYTERPENLGRYRHLYLSAGEERPKTAVTNEQSRVCGSSVIVRLKECTDRHRAEELVGMHIWVSVNDLPPAAEGEFYLHTLKGKRALTKEGQDLGHVAALMTGPTQDLLVIRNGSEEILVPAVRTFITTISGTEVVLDLPPGLVELNRGSGKQG